VTISVLSLTGLGNGRRGAGLANGKVLVLEWENGQPRTHQRRLKGYNQR
jgi:hypothetical protein